MAASPLSIERGPRPPSRTAGRSPRPSESFNPMARVLDFAPRASFSPACRFLFPSANAAEIERVTATAAGRERSRAQEDGLAAPEDGLAAQEGGLAAPEGGLPAPVDGLAAPAGGLPAPVDGLAAPAGGL